MARIEHGTHAHIAALAACVAAVLVRRWLWHMYEEHAGGDWEYEGDGEKCLGDAVVEKDGAADIDPEKQSQACGNLKTPLLLWALFTLPMNVAAWAIPNIFWTHDSPSLSVSMRISLVLMGLSPVLASLRVLISSLKRTTIAESDLRPSMLDGAVTAPLSMLWLWYVFPDRLGWNASVACGAFAHALLQAAGWMYFVRRSESESLMAPLGAPVSNV